MIGFKQASRFACPCCIMPFEQLSSEDLMRDELYKMVHVLGLSKVLGTGTAVCSFARSLACAHV